jgi:hypothetical protein
MLDDLCFYWAEHGASLIGNSEPLPILTAAVFMQKIVASHYIQLIEIVRANIYNLEFQLSRRNILAEAHVTWFEERWSDLQTWSRRISEYTEDIEAIMIGLRIQFSASPIFENKAPDWKRYDTDFQYIHYRLKVLKAYLDVVNNSITSLEGIAGNQQALREARRSVIEAKAIKILTVIGMIFIPLAYCNGLFSMNDQYLPGKSSFGIYWAVAVPLVVAEFLVAYFVNLGYDSEGGWDLATLLRTLSKGKI